MYMPNTGNHSDHHVVPSLRPIAIGSEHKEYYPLHYSINNIIW